MNTPLIVTQLLLKRAEIEAQIDALNARLTEARADLLHVVAVVRLYDPFAAEDRPATAYHGATKAIRRSELFVHCQAAMGASHDPLSTRDLARHVITAEGWDSEDRRLRLTIAHRVATMMTRYERRGLVSNEGLRAGVTLWRLA